MNRIGDWFIGLLWVAAIFVLVRPGSQGPGLVQNSLSGLNSMLSTVTGGGTWAKA